MTTTATGEVADVLAADLGFAEAPFSADDLERDIADEAIFDSIVSAAFDESFAPPVVGPNCLVLYQFVLSEDFHVGPNGEIYSSDI